MDVFNFAKAVEQGIYDVMMWIFFYPYTLLRIVFFPASTLQYVHDEAGRDPEISFAGAMRPALMLFISIALGSLLAPFNVGQIRELQQYHFGRLLVDSWFTLLVFRMILYSFYALAGALLFDLLTPGTVTRDTLRVPFYQQCYICAPFALVLSPLFVRLTDGGEVHHLVTMAAVVAWFVAVQFVFFRQHLTKNVLYSGLLAIAVLVIGTLGLPLSNYVVTRF